VILIEQPIERTGTPPDLNYQRSVECSQDATQSRHGGQMAGFRPRNSLLRAARLRSQIYLPPTQPASKRAHYSADSLVVHGMP
jgi:hypothetical protein